MQYHYDAMDRKIRQTDAEGNQTGYAYDALMRLTQTISPNCGITKYTYDAHDALVKLTDSLGKLQ